MLATHVTLSLTHACNNACSYCYAGKKSAGKMSYATAVAAIDLAFSDKPEKVLLGFFGGEPLLEWELLRAATDYAQERAARTGAALQCTVTTNGTLLTEEKMSWLYGNKFWIGISVDGNRAMHDICRKSAAGASSFEASLAGLRTALAADPKVEAIMVADPANVRHLGQGVAFLFNETNCTRLAVNPNFYTEWPDALLAVWKEEIEKIADLYIALFRAGRPVSLNIIENKIIARIKGGLACTDQCRFGDREMAVAPSGRIYPCERLIGDDNDDTLCIGQVGKGLYRQKLKAMLKRRGRANEECESCAINDVCQSHCGCVNYALTGAIDRTAGTVCWHERTTAAAAHRAGGVLFNEANPAFLRRFYHEEMENIKDPAINT